MGGHINSVFASPGLKACKPGASRADQCDSSSSQTELVHRVVRFTTRMVVMDWMMAAQMGRAVCFPQSISRNANLTWTHPHGHTQLSEYPVAQSSDKYN